MNAFKSFMDLLTGSIRWALEKKMLFLGDHFKGTRGNYMRFRGKLDDCRSCPMQSICMKKPVKDQGRQVSFYAGYSKNDSCLELMKCRIDSE